MDYRKELKKRKQHLPVIIKRCQDMGNPIPDIILEHAGKIAFLPTHVASGSQIDYQFQGMALRYGLVPMWVSFSEDIFLSCNQRKKMYLHTSDVFGNTQKLTNPNKWEGKKISEIILDSGENLVEYHFGKWQKIPGKKFHHDMSKWLQHFGKADDYYEHAMLIEGFFGVSFWPENIGMYQEGEKEQLLNAVINPAMSKIEEEFGLKPLREKFLLKPSLY